MFVKNCKCKYMKGLLRRYSLLGQVLSDTLGFSPKRESVIREAGKSGPASRENNCGAAINRACNRMHPALSMQIRSDTVLEIRLGPPRASTIRRLRRQWEIINRDK